MNVVMTTATLTVFVLVRIKGDEIMCFHIPALYVVDNSFLLTDIFIYSNILMISNHLCHFSPAIQMRNVFRVA